MMLIHDVNNINDGFLIRNVGIQNSYFNDDTITFRNYERLNLFLTFTFSYKT